MNKEEKSKLGKRSKARGSAFERKVRADLENKGIICSKWMNQVEFDENGVGKLVAAKHKFCGFGRPMMLSSGFPDFIAYRLGNLVTGVEAKINGYLDKIEKEKVKWLLDNKVFDKILVAHQEKDGRNNVIVYKEVEL